MRRKESKGQRKDDMENRREKGAEEGAGNKREKGARTGTYAANRIGSRAGS